MSPRARLRRLLLLVGLALPACSGADRPASAEPEIEPAAAARTAAVPAPSEAPDRTSPAPPTIGGIVAAHTDVRGVVADLVSAERNEGRLTVAVRFRNVSEEPRRIEITDEYSTRWRLVAGGREWPLASAENGGTAATAPPRRTLKPGQAALWRGTFVAPPPEVHTFRLEIPRVSPFEDVPISDEE